MFRKSIFAIQRDLVLGVISETLILVFVSLMVLAFGIILLWWYL